MTVIADKRGNLFNAELILGHENDPDELKMLGRALLEQRNELLSYIEKDVRSRVVNDLSCDDDDNDKLSKLLNETKLGRIDHLLTRIKGENL